MVSQHNSYALVSSQIPIQILSMLAKAGAGNITSTPESCPGVLGAPYFIRIAFAFERESTRKIPGALRAPCTAPIRLMFMSNSNSNSEIMICSTRGAWKCDILTVSQHNFYVYVNSPIPIPKSASAQHGAPQNVIFWRFHSIIFMFMLMR